jgi:nitrite reductase/ring-hydroxylating ferredoxin subunit
MAQAQRPEQQWVCVARAGEIPPGTVKAVWVRDRAVAVVNREGSLYALGGTCPHREGPLGEGRLVGDELACPWHGFRYDPRTGRATMPADHPGVPTVPVRVVGDEIQVALSEDD